MSPPGPSFNMRKSFMVPNNILQKPHTSKIQSAATSLRPNQSMANVHNNQNLFAQTINKKTELENFKDAEFMSSSQRPSRNHHDISRLSLHSQSARRVNGAPIFANPLT